MKKSYYIKRILLGALLVGLVGCIGFVLYDWGIFKTLPKTEEYIKADRNEQWISDIDYLEVALPKMHKNLFFKQSKDFFIDNLEELKAKVPEYTDNEINYELSKIVSYMGDTHTNVNMGVEKMYPLSLFWYDEGIYIVDTDERYKDLLYSKIISLNDRPIEDVAYAFKDVFFSGANENWFKNQVMYYVVSESLLEYVGIIHEEEISLKVQKPDGSKEQINMLPVKNGESRLIQDDSVYTKLLRDGHEYENYWFECLPDEKVMYVNYRCAVQMNDKPSEIFANELEEVLKKEDVEKLVIDLRQNQGGGDPVFTPIFKKIKSSKLNAEGKLYVLIGRKTYSAGMNAAIKLKEKTHATLIGESTGGRPSHYGSTKHFKLPNSGLNVNYSTLYIKHLDEHLESLEPDVKVGVSAEQELNGVDSALDWIFEQ